MLTTDHAQKEQYGLFSEGLRADRHVFDGYGMMPMVYYRA